MSKKLQTLIQNTIGDGARAAKYMMTIDRLPGNSSTWPVQSKSLSIMCKGAIFPGKNLTTITYLYKGRNIVIPSHVKYNQTFELTFYLNESHNARIAFSDWMQGFDQSYESYYTGTNVGAANSASKDIINSGSSFTENVRDAKTDLEKMIGLLNLTDVPHDDFKEMELYEKIIPKVIKVCEDLWSKNGGLVGKIISNKNDKND